jgi:hypothetical protein
MRRTIIIIVLFFITAQKSLAQNEGSSNTNSIDAIIENLYKSISGPTGKDRNWNTFRSLFANEARMYIATPSKDSGTVLRIITPEQYIERNNTRLADMGFTETEIHRITDSYGAITHVFSTYESHFINSKNEDETVRGINSIQLFFDGNRYYILTICWDADPKNKPVPERYLNE